ncbi:Ribosomal RNA small subunit methyltransferase E [Acidisarcina polymorpha]|uniref:Ribosomal RNA small subunit methyltransferase E n=1 Tax=Acidisarcina polymorpha TaxID=2211140 RepID=A0A2Z5FW28_9BACT|nr:RsmE family RNA methyltransferase [Acidisarcina polymorpha]AXC11068.1 Ribosomal RNA small subunit methyltransferase E [Acidisarcina polymorpha]
MTRRRWIADQWDESHATLSGSPAMHLVRVLRARPGMVFDLVAGDRVRRAVISEIEEGAVRFLLGEDVEAEAALPITLVLAVFKFDRMEWAIEKVTELGAACIVPVIARRTEKHLAQASTARVERWRRIAREAAQQSRRSDLLRIQDPAPLKDVVGQAPHALRLLLAERERSVMLRDAIEYEEGGASLPEDQEIWLAVGPEGGWAPEEDVLFSGEAWKPVSLGPRILRAETAAIAAVSTLAALLD